MKAILQNLEIHAAHACNLSCESCSHFSNHGHKGILSLDEAKEMLERWSPRLYPMRFSILGGEPTINPDLIELIKLARSHFPVSTLRLVTNGAFLHRHPELPLLMEQDKNIRVEVSVHHESPEYQAYFKPIKELIDQWNTNQKLNFVLLGSYQMWTRRYKGSGEEMLPYEDANPAMSWSKCPARECRQLFRGRLWKCSPIAYLQLQGEKYKLSEKWDPYLAYQGLSPDCSDEELKKFLDARAEPICNMCAANPEKFVLPNPLRVTVGGNRV